MDTLDGLTTEQRAVAMARFHTLQPHLEGHIPLNHMAQQASVAYNKTTPNRSTTSANTPKQTTVNTADANSINQNPSRGNNAGNAKNIGKVGTTYQKVYHA